MQTPLHSSSKKYIENKFLTLHSPNPSERIARAKKLAQSQASNVFLTSIIAKPLKDFAAKTNCSPMNWIYIFANSLEKNTVFLSFYEEFSSGKCQIKNKFFLISAIAL